MRFLFVILVLAAIGLALTNPSTEEARGQINALVAAQLAKTPVPSVGGLGVPSELIRRGSEKFESQIYIDRQNYRLFSIFKVTIGGNYVVSNTPEGMGHEGGQPLPGCLIGIARQVIPYDKC